MVHESQKMAMKGHWLKEVVHQPLMLCACFLLRSLPQFDIELKFAI